MFEQHLGDACLLTVEGVLDGATYRQLRDSVIKAALGEPAAVIVDVAGLQVPSSSAWSVFASARWHVSTWPNVPILLTCTDAAVRATLARVGVARYVPVYPSRGAALQAVSDAKPLGRLRARADLPANNFNVTRARALVADWLMAWSYRESIPIAGMVTTVFVENVLAHSESELTLIVEGQADTVTVAVSDCSAHQGVPP